MNIKNLEQKIEDLAIETCTDEEWNSVEDEGDEEDA